MADMLVSTGNLHKPTSTSSKWSGVEMKAKCTEIIPKILLILGAILVLTGAIIAFYYNANVTTIHTHIIEAIGRI